MLWCPVSSRCLPLSATAFYMHGVRSVIPPRACLSLYCVVLAYCVLDPPLRYLRSCSLQQYVHPSRTVFFCADRAAPLRVALLRPVPFLFACHQTIMLPGPEVGNPSPRTLRRLRHGVPGETQDSREQTLVWITCPFPVLALRYILSSKSKR